MNGAGPTRRTVLAGGLSLAALAALGGCRRAVDLEQRPADAGRVRRGGTLHVVQGAVPLPAVSFSQNNPNFSVNRAIWNTLVDLDHRTLKPIPQLATSWTVSPDGKTYVLQLRDDVRYHSGRAFGPDDVLFVLKYVTGELVSCQTKSAAAAITSAKATGPHEVTVTFGKPINNVWDMFHMLPMVDKETIKDLASGAKMVGTGPFKLESLKPGASVTLTRNEHYWKPGRPYLDGIEITIVPEASSQVAALRSGQAQLALDLSPLDATGLRDDPGFTLVQADAHDSIVYIGCNTKVAPLDQVEVRQAIAWAVDRDRVLAEALGGIGRTSSVPWSPSSPAWNLPQVNTYHYDPDRAKALLRRTGHESARIDLYYSNTVGTNAAVGLIAQANLQDVGIDCKLVPLDNASFQKELTGGTLHGLFVNVHGFGQLDPSTLAKGALPFNAMMNSESFSNAEYAKLANALWVEKGAALPRLYKQLTELLLEQQFVVDLVAGLHTYTISNRLQGLSYNMYDFLVYDDMYLV